MATLQNGDKFLVQRTDSQSGISTNYQVSQENLMANLADDDLLLVQRTTSGISTNYCISASDLKEDLGSVNGLIRPPVEVLTPLNGAGITEFDQYEPLSSTITAVGEAGTIAKNTDDIQSVADESAWNESQVWSSGASVTTGTAMSGRGLDRLFNGIVNNDDPPTNAFFESDGNPMTVTFSSPITATSSIKMWIGAYYAQTTGQLYVNGNNFDVSNVPSNNNDPILVDLGVTSLTSFGSRSNQTIRFIGIVVDGKLLVDAIEDSQTWSTTNLNSNSNVHSSYPVTLAFDGNIDQTGGSYAGVCFPYTSGSASSRYVQFDFTEFGSATSVEVILSTYGTGWSLEVNGSSVSGVPTSNIPNTSVTVSVSGFTSIKFTSVDGNNFIGVAGIKVDGKLLVDEGVRTPETSDNKILSFPTNTNFSGLSVGDAVQQGEYATLNPSDNPLGNAGTLTNGNLNLANPYSNYSIYRGTVEIPSTGKWYYECTFNGTAHSRGAGAQYSGFGIAKSDVNITGFGDGNSFWIADTGFADKWSGTGTSGRSDYTGELLDGGHVVGLALDRDNDTFELFVNGSPQGPVQTGSIGYNGAIKPYAFCYNNNYTTLSLNFGQNAWAYEPPSGYSGLREQIVITAIDADATPPTVTVDGGDWDTSNQSQVWSAGLTTPSNTFNGGQPATDAFDGDLATFAGAGSVGEDMVFQLTTPVSYSDSVEVYISGHAGQIILNSNSPVATTDSPGWVTLVSGSSGSISSITIDPNSNRRATITAIRVDGKLLVDAIEDSEVWSSSPIFIDNGNANYSDGSGTRAITYAFDGVKNISNPNEMAFPVVGGIWNLDFGSRFTNAQEVKLHVHNGNGPYLKLNGNDVGSGAAIQVYTIDVTGTGLLTLEFGYVSSNAATNLGAIEVDGKLLIDAGIRDLGGRNMGSSISYEKSLTFTDTTQLANMVTPLEMVDTNGDVVTPVSDTISNVSNNVLTLASNTNLEYFLPGDEVQTGVQVVSVDAAAPSITVDGGEWLGADGTNSAKKISRSLSFDSASSDDLRRTFTSAGNTKTFTLSFWVKRSKLGTNQRIFACYPPQEYIRFDSNDTLRIFETFATLQTTQVFRDCSKWHHFVISVDSTQTTASDRIKFYVDGTQVTDFTTATYPSLNADCRFNTAVPHQIGSGTVEYFDGYLADFRFIDSQALAPTAFGEFDVNGVWQFKAFSGTSGIADNSQVWSSGADNSTLAYSSTWEKVFDGTDYRAQADGGWSAAVAAGVVATHTLPSSISGTIDIWASKGTTTSGQTGTVVKLLDASDNVVLTWDLTGVPSGSATWQGEKTTSTEIAKIRLEGGSGTYASTVLQAIKVNGKLLVDSGVSVTDNSFHLDFADNSSDAALGYDAAGSNDWTVNNLTVGSGTGVPIAITWSSLDSYPGASYGTDPTRIFDGVQNTATANIWYCAGSNTVNLDNLASKLPSYVGTFEIFGYQRLAPMHVTINGVQHTVDLSYNQSTASYRWASITVNGSIDTLSVTGDDTSYWGIGGFRIDGTVLVDGQLNSDRPYDNSLDTPNLNYATLNPLAKNSTVTLSNGNLEVTSPSWAWATATIAVSSGKWYWELTRTNAGSDNIASGIVKSSFNDFDYNFAPGGAAQSDIYAYTSLSGNKEGQGSSTSYGNSYTEAGDVIGVALDMDAGTLTFYKNGVSQGQAFSGITDEVYPVWGGNGGTASAASLNFGQRPFTYAAPSGYNTLYDTNLPEATIKDGSKHFDAVTFTGSSSGGSFTIPNFEPDLIWCKNRDGSKNHILQDSVRGFGDFKSLYSNLTLGDLDGNNGGTNNIMSVSGSTVNYGTNDNFTGNMVAWAWNAGENSNKTYNVTVVSSKYHFDGHGTSGVTLDLEKGSTYIFDQSDSSNSGHPIRFGISANGTDYTTGVTHTGTPGTAGAKTTLVVASDAPTLYYSCNLHSGMGGQINTNSTAGATVLSGSLTSSLYNQSRNWSTTSTGGNNSSHPKEGMFDGVTDITSYPGMATSNAATTSGNNLVVNFTESDDLTGTLQIYFCRQSNTASTSAVRVEIDEIIGGIAVTRDITSFMPDTTTANDGGLAALTLSSEITLLGPLVKLQIITGPTLDRGFCSGIVVGGKLLVDSNVSAPSIPSMNSVVKANPAAGFSVVKYTGDASSAGNSQIAHGLNAAPSMVISKDRDASTPWIIQHASLGEDEYLRFDTNAVANSSSIGGGALPKPTSDVFYASWLSGLNSNGNDHIAYCFAPVEGYSAMGIYTGNGSSTDGPFIHTGFKPRFIMVKNTIDDARRWVMIDTERYPINGPQVPVVWADRIEGDSTTAENQVDILDNGFKWRYNNGNVNASGKTYIYMAFAENPVAQGTQIVTTGDTQVALDPLAAIATDIVETNGTTMYLNSATGPWRTGLSVEGSQINAAPPGPTEITFTTMNDGTTPVSMIDATLSTRTWTLESGAASTGPWTLIDTYTDFDATDSQDGSTPWTTTKPTLQPNTYYRVKVSYDSTNADSVESVFSTFKTGDA